MIELAVRIYTVLGVLVLAIVAGMRCLEILRARAVRRKALSYCRRDAEGNVYVMDPQKKTWHRLDNLLVQRVCGDLPKITPRQKRKVRARIQQARSQTWNSKVKFSSDSR